MKLAIQIAWRFLASAKRQTFIIVLGIAVGVSVQVFIGSLITGLQDSLVDKTIGSSSHITVLSNDENNPLISNYQSVMDDIEQNNQEISVISPTVDLGGILEKGLVKKEILFRGLDFQNANEIYKFDQKLTSGSRLPEALNEVILGKTIQTDLDLSLGDTILIDINGTYHTLTVVGFFDFNVFIVNKTWGVSTLGTLQQILGESSVTSIELQIDQVFDAEGLALALDQDLIDNDLYTTNWMAENQELLSGLSGQSTSSLMIQVFVIISVVLGISSVLAITVMQKSKQIGIMKAMGILDRDASLVFLSEGFILGIFGAIGGVLLGYGLLYSFTTFALNPDGTPVVPLSIEVGFIALSAMIALVASTLASLIPAIKSSKLTVIEVIRNA
jgi:lipoprotein-releasing system permease protein